jgi:FAD/FMN-containing dehydrogenase
MTMPRSLDEILAHADELADTFEDYDPQPGDEERITPGSLRLIAYRRAQSERELAEAARTAHEQGMSWRAIGEAIGTSGEAARQRYGAKKSA